MIVTLLLCERQASHAADTLGLFCPVGTGGDLLSFPGIAGSSGRRGVLMADTSYDGENQCRKLTAVVREHDQHSTTSGV